MDVFTIIKLQAYFMDIPYHSLISVCILNKVVKRHQLCKIPLPVKKGLENLVSPLTQQLYFVLKQSNLWLKIQ